MGLRPAPVSARPDEAQSVRLFDESDDTIKPYPPRRVGQLAAAIPAARDVSLSTRTNWRSGKWGAPLESAWAFRENLIR